LFLQGGKETKVGGVRIGEAVESVRKKFPKKELNPLRIIKNSGPPKGDPECGGKGERKLKIKKQSKKKKVNYLSAVRG